MRLSLVARPSFPSPMAESSVVQGRHNCNKLDTINAINVKLAKNTIFLVELFKNPKSILSKAYAQSSVISDDNDKMISNNDGNDLVFKEKKQRIKGSHTQSLNKESIASIDPIPTVS